MMKVKFESPELPSSGVLVTIAGEKSKLSYLAAELDKQSSGHLTRAMKAANFTGKKDQVLDIVAPNKSSLDRVFLIGAGETAKLTAKDVEYLGGTIAGALQNAKVKAATIDAELPSSVQNTAALLASGANLRIYSFNKYKSRKAPEPNGLASLTLLTKESAKAQRDYAKLEAVAEGVHLARDLVNEPPNELYPVSFANRARGLAKYGLGIEILTPAQMKKLGMGALLGVGQGSAHEPRLVVMKWLRGKKGSAPVAFIGKGVTFDTGGISIKPASGMEDMKGDMGGAATVTGLMLALARRRAKVNAIGVLGLVENMPSGTAQRPGDIVKSMSGQTIAVLNTDAEGRLVLADALWYTQKRFKPKFMINLATLTGAIMVALGKEYAGMFSNNDELAARLYDSGQATGERVWRMPMAPEYDKLIDFEAADMKNIGGRHAGSVTAAQFLQRFVNNIPWAHLDVAGTAMDSVKTPISQGWASGWGVRLLDRLVAEHYES